MNATAVEMELMINTIVQLRRSFCSGLMVMALCPQLLCAGRVLGMWDFAARHELHTCDSQSA
jgi:hypothetical protein